MEILGDLTSDGVTVGIRLMDLVGTLVIQVGLTILTITTDIILITLTIMVTDITQVQLMDMEVLDILLMLLVDH